MMQRAVTGHGAGNIIGTLEGTKEGVDPIYFTAHMDTVVPGMELNHLLKMDILIQTEPRF